MEEILLHLDQIKENLFKQKEDNQEKSKYFNNILISNLDNNKRNENRKSSFNYQKMLILSRPSMINISKNIKTIDISHKFYLIEESSDNEDGYNEDTKATFPSLMKVAKNIFDPNLIMILTDIKYFPKESQPGLIISGIEDWVKEKHIKYFLRGVPSFKDKYKSDGNNRNIIENNDLDLHSIQLFTEQNKRYAYVKLNNFDQMETIGNYFLNPIKKLHPSYNSQKEKLEVYFTYDLLKLTKNHWYGVILRNLPPNCNDKSIYNFTDQKIKNGVKYCLNPINIDNIYCSLVVCKELEYAEKLCFELNNTQINNKYIKAHLHPQICKIKNDNFYTNYETYSKEGYLFNINAEQSEKCLEYAKSFMEFFYPDYFNSFNNNKSKKKEKENKAVNDNNENNKKNKEKEKNLKREKDLTLASSILDLFKKSKSIEDFKKINSQNIKEKPLINNIKEENITNNNMIIENQNNELQNKNMIKSTIIQEQNSQTNLDINKERSKALNLNKNATLIESNNNIQKITPPNQNTEKNKIENNNININKESNDTNIINYSQEEINYYTYNMGDEKYYEDLEFQHQRKSSSYNQRNNYKNDYKSFNKANNFNKDYKSQRYEYNNNNKPSPHRQYNTSYKKYNLSHQTLNRDREYNSNRNYDNFKEKIKDKEKEKSRERIESEERKKFRDNRDTRYNRYYNSDKRRDKERDREYIKERDRDKGWNRDYNRERSREREYDRERNRERQRDEEREGDRERFSDNRNRRYNDYRYNERNNNNYNDRRKDSWNNNKNNSRQRNDNRNDRERNDRERKDRYFNNNEK